MLTFEDVRDRLDDWQASLTAEQYRDRVLSHVATLARGDLGRAEMLSALSESAVASSATQADLERAAEWARQSLADGGQVVIDPRIALLRALFRLDREDEATAIVRECLRDRTPEHVRIDLHATLGEVLEDVGRHREAQRAYTVGLKDFEPDLDDPDFGQALCLAGRYRSRRSLGLGIDSLDREFEETTPEAAELIKERAAAERAM